MLGFCRRPSTLVVGLLSREAPITTLPFTDWMGSITTATALRESCLLHLHQRHLPGDAHIHQGGLLHSSLMGSRRQAAW